MGMSAEHGWGMKHLSTGVFSSEQIHKSYRLSSICQFTVYYSGLKRVTREIKDLHSAT